MVAVMWYNVCHCGQQQGIGMQKQHPSYREGWSAIEETEVFSVVKAHTGQGIHPPLNLSASDCSGLGRRLISALAVGCLSCLTLATGG